MSEEKPATPRIVIMKIDLKPDTQSEEARQEMLNLFVHLDSLHKKEDCPDSDTIAYLYDYYKRSPEERAALRLKLERANLGYGINNRIHVFYRLTRDSEGVIGGVSIGAIEFNTIVGYICYYDDEKEYNPTIYIDDRFVIKEFRSKGFFRGALANIISTNQDRVPLFKTDILTESRDDIDLFVSLGFFFVRPRFHRETCSQQEAIKLGYELTKEVKETENTIESFTERYKPLIDPQFQLFLMAYMTPYCHSCNLPPKENEPLIECNQCLSVLYCSFECEKKAWPLHKKVCSETRL